TVAEPDDLPLEDAEPRTATLLAGLEQNLEPEADPKVGPPGGDPLADRVAAGGTEVHQTGTERALARHHEPVGVERHRRRDVHIGADPLESLGDRAEVPHSEIEDGQSRHSVPFVE